jgi:hypothetical protein
MAGCAKTVVGGTEGCAKTVIGGAKTLAKEKKLAREAKNAIKELSKNIDSGGRELRELYITMRKNKTAGNVEAYRIAREKHQRNLNMWNTKNAGGQRQEVTTSSIDSKLEKDTEVLLRDHFNNKTTIDGIAKDDAKKKRVHETRVKRGKKIYERKKNEQKRKTDEIRGKDASGTGVDPDYQREKDSGDIVKKGKKKKRGKSEIEVDAMSAKNRGNSREKRIKRRA